MFNKKITVLLSLLISIFCCSSNAQSNNGFVAPEEKENNSQLTDASWKSLPAKWKSFNYDQWISYLNINKSACAIASEVSGERLMQTIKLTPENTLLLIACEFGAYQDAYFLYVLNTSTGKYRSLIVETPNEFEGKWSFVEKTLVWGSFWVGEKGMLEITYLSSGSGMCGHRSVYRIDMLVASWIAVPFQVYGDADCYNGVRVDDWPKISK